MSQWEKYRNGEPHEFFGRAVTCTRVERGWKRKELVDRVGMSTAYLAEIENGKKLPGSTMLARLAHELGTTPRALLERAEEIERLYG